MRSNGCPDRGKQVRVINIPDRIPCDPVPCPEPVERELLTVDLQLEFCKPEIRRCGYCDQDQQEPEFPRVRVSGFIDGAK